MANLKPVHSISRNDKHDEDDLFGWQLFHDRQRNLVYYLHSYTGEVRWPRPETVGFVMHGLKPLPANSAGIDTRTDSIVNPDIWSPFYPHVVMLPSGLVQVHPGPNSETKGAAEMWCGYNRFPLTTGVVDGALSEQHRTKEISRVALLASTEPRILPPTWEISRSGSPFLPPYPVAILKDDDTEDKSKATPSPLLDEQFHTPVVDGPHTYSHLQNGDLGRVHGSMDWTTVSSHKTTKEGSVPKQQPASKGVPVPNTEKKEHNRKGYLLRQARKMMRESNANATVATSLPTSKQRKDQETKATSTAKLQDNDQNNCINNGDCETLL